MAVKSKKNQKQESASILEDADALAAEVSKAEEFVKQNRNRVVGVGVAVVFLVAAYFGYRYYTTSQNDEAQIELFQAHYYWEADSLAKALNGDGLNPGLLEIADDYGATKAGNLASYMAGTASLKQGDYDQALDYLKGFSSSDLLIQAHAYSLIGDCYMEKGNYIDAAENYERAAKYKSNESFSPIYWMKAGLAYRKGGNNGKAIAAYDVVIEDYYNTQEYSDAVKYKAMLKYSAN